MNNDKFFFSKKKDNRQTIYRDATLHCSTCYLGINYVAINRICKQYSICRK